MPVTARTAIKVLLTSAVIPGLFYTLMGLGIAPLDKTAGIAAPFISPLGIPVKPFLCVLGPAKILGGLSLWGVGPMPEMIGRVGLVITALCGAYGHSVIGESPIPPMVYAGMIGGLFLLDKSVSKGKKL